MESENQNDKPLTPEQLEGIRKKREVYELYYSTVTAEELAKSIPLLLAHIESQTRRVDEVEKERDEFKLWYQEFGKALEVEKESTKSLRSQLSTAQEAIGVKDALLIERASEGCEGSHGYGNCVERDRAEGDKSEWCQPCRCQAALSPAGSGGGDDKALLQKARWVATEAHLNQFRRDGKTPYITHPETVANMVEDRLKPIALLHDVVEDSPVSIEELRENFPPYVADAVDALTRREGEGYDTYIKRVCMNPDAVKVKLADMAHNLSCEPSDNSVAKIRRSLPILIQSISGEGEK